MGSKDRTIGLPTTMRRACALVTATEKVRRVKSYVEVEETHDTYH
jgi:hypothetical protein